MTLGLLIEQARKRKGWSLRRTGELVGKSASMVFLIEKGKNTGVSDETLLELTQVFELDIDEVFFLAGRLAPDIRPRTVGEAQILRRCLETWREER